MRASLRAGASTSALAPHSRKSGAVVRDFKNHAFPMAEERWSVAEFAEKIEANFAFLGKRCFSAIANC
jgi:hypothetical protein